MALPDVLVGYKQGLVVVTIWNGLFPLLFCGSLHSHGRGSRLGSTTGDTTPARPWYTYHNYYYPLL